MEQKNSPFDLHLLTDLAVESRNLTMQRTGQELEGVRLDEEEVEHAKITRIRVMNDRAAQAIGKKPGDYITIETRELQQGERQLHEYLSGVMAKEINTLVNYPGLTKSLEQEPTILVIGLGNWNATPDALGPRVIHHLLVTRHLYDAAPADARQGMRPVCALAPGVLGLTGIETAEILKGVIDKVHPDLVIAIDALAARETHHLASTIQISNTGIYPGSGVGNQRIGITQEDMGVPVIAVGVPTVVNSVTIVNDTIDKLMQDQNIAGTQMQNRLQQINDQQKQQIIQQVLQPYLGDLIMAPRGIDKLIRDVGRVIAGGLNIALHPDINQENVSLYLQ